MPKKEEQKDKPVVTYNIEFKPGAVRDLKNIIPHDQQKITDKIETLKKGLSGDVKQLTNFTPEYRLRIGVYRVLFEIEGQNVIIYLIKHRKDAYR